jgi:hypothetical protein
MCSVRTHTGAAERNATLHTNCLRMSSSQPLIISRMFGFCKLAAAWWAICWSLYRLWLGLRDQTRGGGQPAFGRVAGPLFASLLRFGPRRCAAFALATWPLGGRRRDGPADWPRRRYAARIRFLLQPFWRPAAMGTSGGRSPRPERPLNLTILKRLSRVAV